MPLPDRALRVGILGAGWVAGARHFPAYRKHPDAAVVAVCDRHLDRATRFAATRAIPYATDQLGAFLAQDLDLVSVCTPPFAHSDQAIAALGAGCHVFMEKPMAMTPADAGAIAAAAQASGRLLCVSHNFWFARSIRRLRRAIASGEAGPIQSVVGVQASSPRRRLPSWYGRLPAGLFFDESPHLLYLIAGLLGNLRLLCATAVGNDPGAEQPVRSVHAMLSSPLAPATVSMTFEAPVSEWHLIVVCERRVLLADLFRDIGVVLGSDRAHKALDIIKTSASVGAQHAVGVATSGLDLVRRRQDWGHQTLIWQVIDAVRTGKPSPVPVEDSLNVVRTTDTILRAIDQPASPQPRG